MLCCPLMILGCEKKPPAPTKLAAAVTVDTSKIRCPGIRRADVAEGRRTVAPPVADVTDPTNGKPSISLGRMQEWVDEYDEAVATKNRLIRRLNADKKACRGDLLEFAKAKPSS